MSNESGVSGADIAYCVFSCIWILCFILAAPFALVLHEACYTLFLTYIIYIIWSCCHPSTSYISHAMPIREVFDRIDAAIKEKPTITFGIQCYHYVTRIVYYNDSDGNRRSRRERRRINTHRATKQHNIKKWEDQSPPSNTLHFLDVLMLTRLSTDKHLCYTEKGMRRMHKKYNSFIRKHDRDAHYDKWQNETCGSAIPSKTLCFNEKQGTRPWYTKAAGLYLMDVIMLGWIVRLLLNKNSKIVSYEIKKLIKK